MDINPEWKDEVMAEIDKAIQRGNVDEETLKLMKELLKGMRLNVSMQAFFDEQG